MRGVPTPNLAGQRDDLRGHAEALEDLVRGGVVRHQPEEWRECTGPPANPGPGQLPDRLGLAAQAEACDG